MTTRTATKDEIIEAYLDNNRRNWITELVYQHNILDGGKLPPLLPGRSP